MSTWDVVDRVGSIASIIGLGLTIWLLYVAYKIRNYYTRQLLFPQLTTDLAKYYANVTKAINAKESDKIKSALKKCEVVIEQICKTPDPDLKSRAFNALKLIQELFRDDNTNWVSAASGVGHQIDGLIAACKVFTRVDQWTNKK